MAAGFIPMTCTPATKICAQSVAACCCLTSFLVVVKVIELVFSGGGIVPRRDFIRLRSPLG